MPTHKDLHEDLLNGKHQPTDDYRLTLHTSGEGDAGDGEVATPGYPHGGIKLTGRKVERSGKKRATLTFDPAKLAKVTVHGVTRAVLRNHTSKTTLAHYTFEPTHATNGPLTVSAPSIPLGD